MIDPRLFGFGLSVVVTITAALSPAACAQSLDPHSVYEKSCMRCHNEHAADLARQRLKLTGDKLQVTRSNQDVERLLRSHHGVKITAGQWAAMSGLFRLGLSTGGAFQFRCGACHDRAVDFARKALVLRDAKVVTQAGAKDVAAILTGGHGGPTPAETEIIIGVLKRHLETAPK